MVVKVQAKSKFVKKTELLTVSELKYTLKLVQGKKALTIVTRTTSTP